MSRNVAYGSVSKLFHWLLAALIALQFVIGTVMPEIKRNMQPGTAMALHVSLGVLILGLLVLRFVWRLTHPVAGEPGLPAWQSQSAALVHWALYALVALASVTGWYYVSMRGWSVPFFGTGQLPALAPQGSQLARSIGRTHESLVWVLLAVAGVHAAAALLHHFVLRDGVMRRMLPGRTAA